MRFSARFLQRKFLAISDLMIHHGAAVALRVDPDGVTLLRASIKLGQHIEVHAMGTEENIARQPCKGDEGMVKVASDTRIGSRFAVAGDEADARQVLIKSRV